MNAQRTFETEGASWLPAYPKPRRDRRISTGPGDSVPKRPRRPSPRPPEASRARLVGCWRRWPAGGINDGPIMP